MKFVLFFVALAFVAAVDAAPRDGKSFGAGPKGLGGIQQNLDALGPLATDLDTMEKKLDALAVEAPTFGKAVGVLQKAMSTKDYKAPPAPTAGEGR